LKQPYYIGELAEFVDLIRYTESIDEYGTIERVRTTLASRVSAHVRPLRGGERDRGQQTEARANYLVVLRYRADLTEKDVIAWRGSDYTIHFIMDRGPRAVYLELEVERGAP